MKIAVCDDESRFRETIKNEVYAYSNMKRLDFAIDEYSCGEDLLNAIDKYDIIFMDYQMGGISGLETARIIRKKDITCVIIFLTSYTHFMQESFEVSTYRYLTKPLDVVKLHNTFDDYFEAYGNDYPLLLKIGGDTISIHTRDIVYLEADDKKCYINLVGKQYHCAKSMSLIANLLPNNIFYKTHKSFVVNFIYIDKYDSKNIYFKNGKTAHIGGAHAASFRDAYRIYAKGRKI